MTKIVLSILSVFVILYITFSSYFPDKKVVGFVGSYISSLSLEYIGFITYFYLLLLLYPIYKLNFGKFEKLPLKIVVWISFFITILMFQSLLIDSSLSGKIGDMINQYLSRTIGYVGIWLIILIDFSLVYYMFFNQKSTPIVQQKLKDIMLKTTSNKKSVNIKKDDSKPKPLLQLDMKNIDILDKAIIKEHKNIPKPQTSTKTKENKNEELLQQVRKLTKKKKSPIVQELQENKKLIEETVDYGKSIKTDSFKLPSTNIFQEPVNIANTAINEDLIDKKVANLLEKLAIFKIKGDVVRTYTGPLVTTFEFKPSADVKISKILNLQDDLAMALRAQTIRLQAPIPGKDVVGIEVPNESCDTIYIKELLDSELFKKSSSALTIALGKDIVGNTFITDLKKLPHLLIAGTTGSGKSVGINAMILSFLFKNSPNDLKMIMIDPKMLEFSIYNGIPHLLTPVITKPSVAIIVLTNMVIEMENRYKLMANSKTKNIENYNQKMLKSGGKKLPYIVIIIDELADLMMTSGKDVEISIARLAQMARASGIHLIVATQRPSVDVITGLIKANLPSRISFKVGQKVDSKIILDSMGAEALLGRGDMLFTPPGTSTIVRLHAPWMTESEIENVAEFLKSQQEPDYDESITKEQISLQKTQNNTESSTNLDELYEDAKKVVISDKKTSISYLQRKLRIGYNRAATIIDQLQSMGVLSEPNAKGIRTIL